MKRLILALVLSLPCVAPLQAATGPALLAQMTHSQIDRRAHHCDTPAQNATARCRGI
jgi:hypothetical protein